MAAIYSVASPVEGSFFQARTFPRSTLAPTVGFPQPSSPRPVGPAPVPAPTQAPTAPAPTPAPVAKPPLSPISGLPIQVSIFQPGTTTAQTVVPSSDYQQPIPAAMVVGSVIPAPGAPPETPGPITYPALSSNNFWLIILLFVAFLLVIA